MRLPIAETEVGTVAPCEREALARSVRDRLLGDLDPAVLRILECAPHRLVRVKRDRHPTGTETGDVVGAFTRDVRHPPAGHGLLADHVDARIHACDDLR